MKSRTQFPTAFDTYRCLAERDVLEADLFSVFDLMCRTVARSAAWYGN